MTADQWKDQGLCGACRRRNYCAKPCSANKRMVQRTMMETLMKNPKVASILNEFNGEENVHVFESEA